MAQCRLSFLLLLCLSFISLHHINAHPNHKDPQRRVSLQLPETWDEANLNLNSSVANTTSSSSKDFKKLQKSVQDALRLLRLGLKWFGDAMSQIIDNEFTPTATDALLTEIPNLATVVLHVPTQSWFNTTSSSVSTARPNGTSFLTITSTKVFTVTAPRSSAVAPPSTVKSVLVRPTPSTSSSLLLDRQDTVQVYAGRYSGIAHSLADLTTLCANPDIDIITVAGITTYFSSTTSPCPLPTQTSAGLCNATLFPNPSGIGNCSYLSQALHDCQQIRGKKLFLAIEAGTATSTLHSAKEARILASLLWDMFGAGKAMSTGARKFGGVPISSMGVVFDGFEFLVNTTTIDDEYFTALARRDEPFIPPTLPYFDTLFSSLKDLFPTGDTSKPYYLSVSLPCTRPSILNKPALHLADSVSVRFMDEPACNINGLAFLNFLNVWAQDIADTAPERLGPSMVPSHSTKSSGHETAVVPTTLVYTLTVKTARLSLISTNSRRQVSSALRLKPEMFSIPRYMTLTLPGTDNVAPWHGIPKEKRHDGSPKFILGIRAPTQAIQNGTAITGVGSADPATLSAILQYAKMEVPGFGGVLLWGHASDLTSGSLNGGFLGTVHNVLDGLSFAPTSNSSLTAASKISASATAATSVGTMTNAVAVVTEAVVTVKSTRKLTTTMYGPKPSRAAVEMDFTERPV